jgi:predicted alpha/beta hydrolase family esterase
MKALTSVLLIPGLFNSGPEHWQSLWQAKHPDYYRVQQADWETPHRDDWVQTLHACLLQIDSPIVLAAHSLACATIAHYAAQHGDCKGRIAAALLVAPSDVEAPTYPPGSTGFDPMPLSKLPFRSVLVASTDDPYVTLERAAFFARSWGSNLIKIANAGHINTASGHGPWPEGEAWLEQLREIQT